MTREPNPRTEPLGVLFVCSQSKAKSLEAVAMIDSDWLLSRAILVETRCRARSEVLDALKRRMIEVVCSGGAAVMPRPTLNKQARRVKA